MKTRSQLGIRFTRTADDYETRHPFSSPFSSIDTNFPPFTDVLRGFLSDSGKYPPLSYIADARRRFRRDRRLHRKNLTGKLLWRHMKSL